VIETKRDVAGVLQHQATVSDCGVDGSPLVNVCSEVQPVKMTYGAPVVGTLSQYEQERPERTSKTSENAQVLHRLDEAARAVSVNDLCLSASALFFGIWMFCEP
jgi:hypothetical protein